MLSQGPTGAIAVFMYPYESELALRTEKLIVWNVFDDPLDITERVLKNAVADFTCYARVSSALDGGTAADRRRVTRLLRRDRFRSGAQVNAVKLAEERAREKKEVQPPLGSRLAGNFGLVLFGIFGTAITVVTGLGASFDQLSKWFTSETAMPVITGWYTFCPPDGSEASPKLIDFPYDIAQNAGKVAFLDVQVRVDCVIEPAAGQHATVTRTAEERSLTYSFFPEGIAGTEGGGGRDHAQLVELIPDNGASVRILDDWEGRNVFTSLRVHVEGINDIIYGPYLIKAKEDDAFLSLQLSPPMLDAVMQAAASAIAQQRRTERDKSSVLQPPPSSAEDPIRSEAIGISSPVVTALPTAPPNLPPPLDAKALRERGLPLRPATESVYWLFNAMEVLEQ